MTKSNMNFSVNESAIVCNIIDGEIKARIATRKNPKARQHYKDLKVIDSSPVITKFMFKHPGVFRNKKLIHSDGSNFFGGIVPLSSLAGTEAYREKIVNRMRYEYDISEEEISQMNGVLDDLDKLNNTPEIQKIIKKTTDYKNSIENIWKKNEVSIMKHVKSVLGYEPQSVGKVSTYIMYPNFDTHRSYPLAQNKTFLFFGKRGEKDPNKILAYLTHQAVHQPMLPYKPCMTKKEKEEFHGFIKFLTDKDVYNYLSGKSYLDIITEGEKPEVMGKIYPYWLGYRHRNDDKEGLSPIEEMKKDLKRDKDYYVSLPQGAKKEKMASTYEFDKIDLEKVASYFKARRGITPYEFAKIDFDDKRFVYKDEYLKNKTCVGYDR